jgi:hypothetical protein
VRGNPSPGCGLALGAAKAEGQAPANPVVAITSWQGGSFTYVIAATANGSTYIYNPSEGPHSNPWLNIFGTIDASGKTWSGVKEGYRK